MSSRPQSEVEQGSCFWTELGLFRRKLFDLKGNNFWQTLTVAECLAIGCTTTLDDMSSLDLQPAKSNKNTPRYNSSFLLQLQVYFDSIKYTKTKCKANTALKHLFYRNGNEKSRRMSTDNTAVLVERSARKWWRIIVGQTDMKCPLKGGLT